jgi:hypothetical protein
MTIAKVDDIARVFPGIQDHTVLELLAAQPTVDELEAALLLLTDDDEGLIEIKQRESAQLNRLLEILNQSEIRSRTDRDP